MLPDGAEKQSEDWTIFFLNQTPMNTVAPLFSEAPETEEQEAQHGQRLLYVLSLVRTKRDQTARRYEVSTPLWPTGLVTLFLL